MRPLRRGKEPGVWHSRDGVWTFLRHWGDPAPQRWFAYVNDGDEQGDWPSNDGIGHTTLREVVEWADGPEGEQAILDAQPVRSAPRPGEVV